MSAVQLLYVREHTECYNYVYDNQKSLVSTLFEKDTIRKEDSYDKVIVFFVLKGNIIVSYNEYYQKCVVSEEFFLIPPNTSFTIEVREDMKAMVFYFRSYGKLCQCFSLDALSSYTKNIEPDFHKLLFNQRVTDFLYNLELYLNDGLRCFNFLELKKEEFFLILRAYYSKKELAAFFYPIIGRDISFRKLVLSNYLGVNSTREFAQLAHYSVSGFEKKFYKEFGEYPHQWIMNEKSKKILHDICYTEDSLKDICFNYNFSSPGHFSRFCKKIYGRSPSEIRKEYKDKQEIQD